MSVFTSLRTLSTITLLWLIVSTSQAGDSGVILLYHHISEDTPPSTSVSAETFRKHLTYLKANHTVLPLKDMVETLRNKQPLPDKAVAITFDDGYLDILQQGHPLLKEFGFAYTIFVNPALVGQRADQLTWAQLKQLQAEGVMIANHAMEHQHLLQKLPDETDSAWLQRRLSEIDSAEAMLEAQLGTRHQYLAYPYGEYNQALRDALLEKGYTAFGQHSGPMASYSDFGALPRFAAAGIYARMKTLQIKLNSLAMPVTYVAVQNPELAHGSVPPEQILAMQNEDFALSQVSCFLNGNTMPIRTAQDAILLPLTTPLPAGRSRINCTAPSRTQAGRYYWYSQPWFVPTAEGTWLE